MYLYDKEKEHKNPNQDTLVTLANASMEIKTESLETQELQKQVRTQLIMVNIFFGGC